MTDIPLQQRGGFNTGAEPSSGYFVEKTIERRVLASGATAVLLEGLPRSARVVSDGSQEDGGVILAFNQEASEYTCDLVWRNSFGDTLSLLLAAPAEIPANDEDNHGQAIVILEKVPGFFALAEDESIEIVRDAESASSSCLFFPTASDTKVKPRPSSGSGLSDGNTVTMRFVLPEPDAGYVDIAPPAGKAWSLMPGAKLGRTGAYAASFSTSGECYVRQSVVDQEGVEHAMDGTVDVALTAGELISLGVNIMGPNNLTLGHPNKMRLRMEQVEGEGEPPPLPNGRVLIAITVMEYDLAADSDIVE